MVSICLRVGWALGNVQDRYLRYEAAGDQYLGRVVSGLPYDSEQFAALPPHFWDIDDKVLDQAIRETYPDLYEHVEHRQILRFFIGSLVQHHTYLKKTLPENHPIFSCALFRNPELLCPLQGTVRSGFHSPAITATGLPPHVLIMRSLSKIEESVRMLPDVLDQKI
jgi:hypothetical protein